MREIHTIKPFRGTKLGIIRLDKLAYPGKTEITIGGKKIKPIGFDTYGHPIISESNFSYYKALKANTDRKSETFLTEVTYAEMPFSIKREMYDSKEAIREALNEKDGSLKDLKEILVYRKKAAFDKQPLKNFVVLDEYVLHSDGHIYWLKETDAEATEFEDIVFEIKDENKLVIGKETHLPGEEDVCPICGKNFSITDVEECEIVENSECEKTHKKCLKEFTQEIQMQKASQIIDAVYEDTPEVKIEVEWEDDEEYKTWYSYNTTQGTVSICFKTKVISIKWHDDFKPFDMEIFGNENVTKFDRGIHAWSKDNAIRYLAMAKKA